MRLWPFLGLSLLCAVGCDSESLDPVSTSSSGSTGGASMGGAGGGGGMSPDPSAICGTLGLPLESRSQGPFGETRGSVAGDFELPLMDGSTFVFDERYSGCESYVFSVDTMVVSDLDDSSVWEKDLDQLLSASPRNVHYFFVSRQTSDEAATASLTAMQERITQTLATLAPEDADHFRTRLHVVATRAQALPGWIGGALNGHGRIGMAIDRFQRIRGGGMLADVTRFSNALSNGGFWPWRSNLAYVANEANFHNGQYERLAPLASDGATEIKLWDGEELAEFAVTSAVLPDAATMAGFDTFQIQIDMICPDETQIELGNCGAWDYLAHFFVIGSQGEEIELARFITTYHRESQWLVDATPMMPLLLAGGAFDFKWSFAPPWNPQPTKTRLSLRLSNQGKGIAPRLAIPLFTGGDFNSSYNAARADIVAAIPANAAKVELVALTTGHGADTAQCAEFCNHQHEYTVNGNVLLQEFEAAGSNEGCIAQLANGMTPNQAGTWWFGRGGWCPGQQVDPWIMDVTSSAPAGQDATVSYLGLFNGATPPDSAGNIVLSSYLVVYE